MATFRYSLLQSCEIESEVNENTIFVVFENIYVLLFSKFNCHDFYFGPDLVILCGIKTVISEAERVTLKWQKMYPS